MTKVLLIIFMLFSLNLIGCNNHSSIQNAKTDVQPAAPTATPSTSPALAVAPTLAMPAPGTTVAPPIVPTGKDDSKHGKTVQKSLPPAIWDRMTRALTREEIDKLPPETREMILRAQGRLTPSPTPASQKK
jgi:uncharacterized lipoprotein NlpE involved in copper resistance